MKNSKIELTYSQQATDYVKGRAYSNPRFFTSPRSDVSKVFIVGDWPKIEEAYKALGVPVERLDKPPVEKPAKTVTPPKELVPGLSAEERAAIEIPADWRDLQWSKPNAEGQTLRGLASKFSDDPVINKDQAVAVIEAEAAKRAPAAVDPLDVPQPEALGLTLRELHADLSAMGVQWENEGPAELLRMRDEARALAEAG